MKTAKLIIYWTLVLAFLVALPVSGWGLDWHTDTVGAIHKIDCPSSKMDSQDHLHIAYGSNHIYYASFNGTNWDIEIVDYGRTLYPTLAFDSQDHPHIAYFARSDYSDGQLKYAYYDGSSWHIETVDSVGGVYALGDSHASIAIDSNDHPHIAYYDATNKDLKYAYYDGSAWQITTVDADGGTEASIALDSEDKPHIVYQWKQGWDHSIRYAYYDGSAWQIETIASDGDLGWDTPLALDSGNKPRVVFYDDTNDDLKYAYRDSGSWYIETVDSNGDVGWKASLTLDSNDNPYIAYRDSDNDSLKYAYRDGDTWQIETVETPAYSDDSTGSFSSITIASDGTPHIVYYSTEYINYYCSILKHAYYDGSAWQIETVDSENELLIDAPLAFALDPEGNPHFAYWHKATLRYGYLAEGEWHIETVDSCGWGGDTRFVSLTMDTDGQPHIAYACESDLVNHDELRYAHYENDSWHIETVEGGYIKGISIKLDSSGNPHIAYIKDYQYGWSWYGGLKYAYYDGSQWNIETIKGTFPFNGRSPSLALDSYGNPHISYMNSKSGTLEYAYLDGSSWQTEVVDPSGGWGSYASLVLDSSDNPHVAYYDTTNKNLKYAYFNGSSWQIETVDSEIDTNGYVLPSLALDSNNVPFIVYETGRYSYDIKYAYRECSGWHIETAIEDGEYASLALDTNNNPHIFFYKNYYDLQYAYASQESITPIFINFFSIDPPSGDPPLQVNITCQASGKNPVDHYEFNLGDGNIVTSENGTALYTYEKTGYLKATCTVHDNQGNVCTSNPVHVNIMGPGALKWKFETNDYIYSSPAIGDNGTIYVGSEDGYLYAINPDGSLNWKFQTDDYVESSPAIGDDGTIYVGSEDGYLYAINPDGSLKWKFGIGGDIDSSPAIGDDGTIYVGTYSYYDDYFVAIYPDGSIKWYFDQNDYIWSSPAVGANGTIYVGSEDGYLYAIYPADGSIKWKFETDDYVESSPAIGADGTIYVGSEDGYLYAINPDGSIKWKFQTDDYVESSPAIGADGTIYVGSEDGYLYAINPDGSLKWKFETGASIDSSPVIGPDGTIFVGSGNGFLYAIYGESGGLASTPWPMFHHDVKHTGQVNETGPINQPPVITSFTADPTEGTAPLTVTFTCEAYDPDGGSIPSIQWYLGDSEWPYYTFDDNFTITHVYQDPGTYTAYCVVWDDEDQNATSGNITITVNAPVTYYNLEVQVTPADGTGGIVTSNTEDISCPDNCSHNYEAGANVTITAEPAEGFTFSGWGGACEPCGTNSQCTITMDANKTCSAVFEEIQNEPPVIDSFTVDPSSGTAPLEVAVICEATDPDGNITAYEFNPDDGSAPITSDNGTFSYTYSIPGSYNATCTAYDSDGASVTSDPVTVTVEEAGPSWNDISEGISYTSSRTLYDRINRAFFVLIDVTNNTGADIAGPVRMVLESSSLDLKSGCPGLEPDGYTDDGKPYFIIVPEGETWDSGETLEDLRLNFVLQRKRLTFELRFEEYGR